MNERSALFAMVLIAVFAFGAHAETETVSETGAEIRGKEAEIIGVAGDGILSPNLESTTSHVLKVGETAFHYTATTGSLPVRTGRDGIECRIFFTSYEAERGRHEWRPAAFTTVSGGRKLWWIPGGRSYPAFEI
jgi:hypothetical protein